MSGATFRLSVLLSLAAVVCAAQGVGAWESRADFPLGLTEVSSAAVGEKVYVICGIAESGLRSSQLFIYDSVGDSWSQGASLPIERGADHCNWAAVDGSLYFLGGERVGQGFLTNRTFRYDPGPNTWTELREGPTPRGASGVAVIDRTIYVAGGEGAQTAAVAFEAYDIDQDRWRSLPSVPNGGRTHLTAQAVDGKLYAIGGRIGAFDNVRGEVFAFDPAGGQWMQRAPMPTPRAGIASGVLGGRIVVFGGEGPSGRPEQTYREVEEYDPTTDSWRSLTPMPNPRHGFYGATVTSGEDGPRIHLAAGGPAAGLTVSRTHDIFFLQPEVAPVFSGDAVVNAASGAAWLSAGSAASVFAAHLDVPATASTVVPLPTRLAGVEVLLDGVPAPLFFVGAGQVNFLVPHGLSGEVEMKLRIRGLESAPATIELQAASPGVFALTQSGRGQGAVLIGGTGAVADGGRPARAGDVLEIYATGLGAVSEAPEAGAAAPTDRLAPMMAQPVVRLDNLPQEVLFAGLAPGLVGVYQVNVRVGKEVSAGDAVALVLEIAGARSNTVTIAVAE